MNFGLSADIMSALTYVNADIHAEDGGLPGGGVDTLLL
jgi:hypothetical protein